MVKRKNNTKSAKSKNAKCAKTQLEAPIELRPGFTDQLIASLTKLIDATSKACIIILKTFTSDPTDVGGDRQIPAWNFIIKKLDFQNQLKLSQQNQRLEDLVRENAEYELRKFRRNIKDNKRFAHFESCNT